MSLDKSTPDAVQAPSLGTALRNAANAVDTTAVPASPPRMQPAYVMPPPPLKQEQGPAGVSEAGARLLCEEPEAGTQLFAQAWVSPDTAAFRLGVHLFGDDITKIAAIVGKPVSARD